MSLTIAVWAQNDVRQNPAPDSSDQAPSSENAKSQVLSDSGTGSKGIPKLLLDFAQDQESIWTSPARIRLADATWLVPLGGIAAGLVTADRGYSASLSRQPATLSRYNKVSNVALGSLIGAGAGMYLLSFPTHNDHWRETAWLAGEAALNSLVVTETLKYSFGRQRPFQGSGAGSFFQGGTSFPSEHAAAAWSVAGVIAHEYPGILPKLFAYSAAAAVDYSRVHARQHFPSDVLIGSTLGYLIAQSIYRRRQEPQVGGATWEPVGNFVAEESRRSPSYMGSPYVPLESWIYPAIERLSALGFISTATEGLRPWTRLECARMVGEASERGADNDSPAEVRRVYAALEEEFTNESELRSGDRNLGAHLESIYTRSLGIWGTPLTDNYHFGQTLLNDYGRPYQQGFNAVAGASGWTAIGPFVVYARGEYQSAPSAPSLSPAALNFIANVDGLPPNPPLLPVAATRRFQLLDAYVGLTLANWQISFGKRSLWWGTSEGGTLMFTNNAAPLDKMFSIDRVTPFRLPWLFRYLGDIRLQAFLGQLSGQEFLSATFSGTVGQDIGQYGHSLNPQPYLSGGIITFKLTRNFEFGMSKTTIYGGPGLPLTPTTFLKSVLGIHVHADSLGDGRSGADFTYRVPKLRDWLTFYGEAMTEDEPSPIPYMRQSIFQGGLHFAKLPKIPRLDLRLEGGSTSPPVPYYTPGYFYTNSQYVSGYTSNGRLIGTWLGRAAQGELVRTNYWLSAKSKIGLELRHRKVDQKFIPQGGNQNDVAVNADIFSKAGFRFSGNLQYERWQIPLLATNRQSNVAASFEFGFWPVGHRQ